MKTLRIKVPIPWTVDPSTSRLQAQSEYRQVYDQDQTEKEEDAERLRHFAVTFSITLNLSIDQQDAKESRCSFAPSSNEPLNAHPIGSTSYAHLKHKLASTAFGRTFRLSHNQVKPSIIGQQELMNTRYWTPLLLSL